MNDDPTLMLLCAHTSGSFDEAIEHYDAAHEALILRMKSEKSIYSSAFYQNCLRYANCLEYVGDIDMAEEKYLEALPGGGLVTGDYAYFLHKKKKNYEQAEKYYKLALQQYPGHSSVHLRYANFLRHVKKDLQLAEKHYTLACDSNYKNADASGTYASFLHGVLKRYDDAQIYYEKAVNEDPTHVNNYCNYGLFLSEEKGDYSHAERLYKHAMELDPHHANTLYNYAVMLDTHLGRKDEAEELYTRVIEIDSRHPYALYNLAVLLEDNLKMLKEETAQYKKSLLQKNKTKRAGRFDVSDFNDYYEDDIVVNDSIMQKYIDDDSKFQDMSKRIAALRATVLDLYERATDADPHDPTAKADCARYIYTEYGSDRCSTEDKELYKEKYAEKVDLLLNEAHRLDPQLEVALYTVASICHNYKKDSVKAESFVKKLLSANPKHVSGMHLLAIIYLESTSGEKNLGNTRRGSINDGSAANDKTKTVEDAFLLLQKCAECSKNPSKSLVEYINAVDKYGTKRHKLAAIAYCQQKRYSNFTDFENKPDNKLEYAMSVLQHAAGKRGNDGELST